MHVTTNPDVNVMEFTDFRGRASLLQPDQVEKGLPILNTVLHFWSQRRLFLMTLGAESKLALSETRA